MTLDINKIVNDGKLKHSYEYQEEVTEHYIYKGKKYVVTCQPLEE